MFEAKLASASTFKKVLEAIRELLTDATWDCRESGIALQAMDSSHVALVALKLRAEGFDEYRCDRSISLGLNLTNMSKIVKTAANDDSLVLRAKEDDDTLALIFQSPNEDRYCQYEIKLMDLDAEHLGIPDTEYDCVVSMPSSEFSRIVRDLGQIGESLTITCTKSGIIFSSKEILAQVRLLCGKQHIWMMRRITKASPLSNTVQLSLSSDVPIVVEYKIEDLGYIRYYLAPKIDDDSEIKTEA
ncbi:Proliferating cell nuclear antigen [Trichinella spiralis]|uniref:DNA sliding clamp PCNA n=1 Tax=Trichinella spiralis TaxID=6334 RepID=A0ABR3KQN2_TRISP